MNLVINQVQDTNEMLDVEPDSLCIAWLRYLESLNRVGTLLYLLDMNSKYSWTLMSHFVFTREDKGSSYINCCTIKATISTFHFVLSFMFSSKKRASIRTAHYFIELI